MSTQVSVETPVEPVVTTSSAAPTVPATSAKPVRPAARAHVALPELRMPPASLLVTAGLFALLFARPFKLLVQDWWSNPEAGHGLLLAPLAIYFAWKSGVSKDAAPNRALGTALLVAAVFFRYV